MNSQMEEKAKQFNHQFQQIIGKVLRSFFLKYY
jgi:hypothetical protein